MYLTPKINLIKGQKLLPTSLPHLIPSFSKSSLLSTSIKRINNERLTAINIRNFYSTLPNNKKKNVPPPILPRENIGIFGCMNAGKSTLMNLLTQQATSIVDDKPGTTADVKVALMEIHNIGPCKLFDTAGYDEEGKLGQKKLQKTHNIVKESDLVIVVIDKQSGSDEVNENKVIELAKKRQKNIIIIQNVRDNSPVEVSTYKGLPSLQINLNNKSNYTKVIEFIQTHGIKKNKPVVPLLPQHVLGPDKTVFLNIPMDAETPGGRLLRPQSKCQEFCLSHFTSTYAYRMDLIKGRSNDSNVSETEKKRFQDAIERIKPSIIITDSQAMDLVGRWVSPDKFPNVQLTTFSIMMINQMTDGQLPKFIKGLEVLKSLKSNDKILISEACNHNRLTDICEDIGTKQIPDKLKRKLGNSIVIDHAFGREFPSKELKEYSLVVHCGGCMIDKQKMCARLDDCIENNIPITNYGLLLTYLNSPKALKRVTKPFVC
ncbi:P-loop containing nucleoside triphosphate hydrolase protein [Piromyces finnis]|uniref:p-loop containing nucleoside triphosphate hydrolase protein n=1 Tax=Piromyces finnis TaxID=1754191 RepID=A0A1Y1VAE2_9FUNG|nr:P-loop containing nucleoside triphosphate hydrolase protein [Piromyces finnis]|eukprot:ORX49704.1 P-loop containing nucleoside triphosphate hydrolase protein [Piromyces finnis]